MSLDANFYTVKNALLWGNCAEHFKKAAQGSLGHRAVHYIIAFILITPVISQIISLFEMIIGKCLLKPAEVTEVEPTAPDPEEQANISARMAELDQYLQTSAGSLSLEESDTLQTQNERWKKEIEEIASTITLPKPSLNSDIIEATSDWDDEFIKKVLTGEENAPSLEHFETVVYTEAMRADKNRETEIIPYVFVGDSCSLEALKKENKLKFGSVIIMTEKRVNFDVQGITKYVFEIQNEAQRFVENATDFKKFFKYIDKARQEKRPILLQCHQGKIASVGLIVAYLSDRLNLATKDAHQYVKIKRLIASLTPKMLTALERLKLE